MKPSMSLSGERIDHKMAAVFDTEADANNLAKALWEQTSLTDKQVTVIGPSTPHQGTALEPEDGGIWRTLVRSHLGLGAVGGVLGFIFFLVLSALGIGFIVQNVVIAGAVMTSFGVIFGLLAAGAFSIRPDHMPYLMKAQAALREGKYVLTVHASTMHQLQEAKSLLESRDIDKIYTI